MFYDFPSNGNGHELSLDELHFLYLLLFVRKEAQILELPGHRLCKFYT